MPKLPSASEPRLIALVLAALIAVLTLATVGESPAAASTAVTPQDERFQPQQVRALPPFGARTVVAPVSSPKRLYPQGAEAAR